jgi:hypothetical protein
MRRVNRNRYTRATGERKPSLKGDDLTSNAQVVTIAEVEAVELPDQRTRRMRDALRVSFAEYPAFHWWPNPGSCDVLFAKLGDDLDQWAGTSVPVHRVSTKDPFDANAVETEKVWTVPADEWDAALKPAPAAAAKRSRKA